MVLEDLSKKMNNEINYKAYADDLVIICSIDSLPNMLKYLIEVTEKYNLKINKKKSNIMAI